MIHEQWRTQVILDVLAHEQETADANVAAANDAIRELLQSGDMLAPGVNVVQVTPEAPVSVPFSGTQPQLYQGTQWCVVYLETTGRISHASGPFATRQLALEALGSAHPEELRDDEHDVWRDRGGNAVAQVTTIEVPKPGSARPPRLATIPPEASHL